MVIINDVLNLSKLEAHQLQLDNVSFNPNALVEDSVKMFSASLQQKGLNIALDLLLEKTFVKGDPNRIKQIILNLISNSIKFTQVGGISIKTWKESIDSENCKLCIKVSDTGIGMTNEEVSKLFTRFFQAGTQQQFQGSGLGLYISHKLVQLMKGTISVKSEKGKGTNFEIHLVCGVPSNQEVQALLSSLSRSSLDYSQARRVSQPKRILIAEDNLINQKVLVNMLTKAGHTCTVAQNGQEALDIITQPSASIDLVLMDLEMPVMGGYEATKKIREFETQTHKPRIPILCLTGNSRDEYKQKAMSEGFDGYVSSIKKGFRNSYFLC